MAMRFMAWMKLQKLLEEACCLLKSRSLESEMLPIEEIFPWLTGIPAPSVMASDHLSGAHRCNRSVRGESSGRSRQAAEVRERSGL